MLQDLPNLDGVDLLFFTSPGAIRLFYGHPNYAQCTLPVATIGEGTARVLPPHVQCVFTGKESTEAAAASFAAEHTAGTIGIVGGTSGRRTLQRALTSHSWRDLVIYETIPAGFPIDADVLVFTSPSNYHAYRSCNPKPNLEKSLVVAIGTTTAASIASMDGLNPMIAENYSARGVWNTILSAEMSL